MLYSVEFDKTIINKFIIKMQKHENILVVERLEKSAPLLF